jgi:hypothetical protein
MSSSEIVKWEAVFPVTLKSILPDTWTVTRRFIFVAEKNRTFIIFLTKQICKKGNFRTEEIKHTLLMAMRVTMTIIIMMMMKKICNRQ